ncbi:hypothetical protein SteCoe_37015 [Stentor coeruleus]|uniref:Electron transfer flavoprotein subunit alpha n=1 Tax=Stentor coeruleus TaxID=5963 RepID=A0A1R2AP47_9CILI|nr:hypothetical protein SteCoe_37015 [Stentor coeruleus]
MFFSRKFTTLILSEHNNIKLNPLVYNAVNAAEYFNDDIAILVAGDACMSVATEASLINGVNKVHHINHQNLKHQFPDSMAKVIKQLHQVHNFKRIIAASSNFSKDIIPRLGGVFEVQPVTEITKIMNEDCYKRSGYSGNAINTIVFHQNDIRLITIRATSFDRNPIKNTSSPIEDFYVKDIKSVMTLLKEDIEKPIRPDLNNAEIIVAVGKGLKNKKGFKIAEELADCFRGIIGDTKVVINRNVCNNELQIGQSWKNVAPKLYVALGISGDIQHLAEMKDSKVIVAINNDPGAPIFSVADYGMAADVFEVVPEMIFKIKK